MTPEEALIALNPARYSDVDARILPILASLVSAAKRSAHLEDARAGCERCRFQGQPSIEEKHGLRWWHPRHPDDWRIGELPCSRPEVWDALSLLPGGTR